MCVGLAWAGQPFTDELVARTGASLASELAPIYLQASPPQTLISLDNEIGWVACAADIIKAKRILGPIVLHVPDCVPSLLFLSMALLAADAILQDKLCGRCRQTAYKSHCLLTACARLRID